MNSSSSVEQVRPERQKKGNWMRAFVFAMSLVPAMQNVIPQAVHAEPTKQGQLKKDKQERQRQEASEIANLFAWKLRALAKEEEKLGKTFPTKADMQKRLEELRTARSIEGQTGNIEQRTNEEKEAAKITITFLTLLARIRIRYPEPQKFIEQFSRDKDKSACRDVQEIIIAIGKLLALPQDLKEEQILLEMISSRSEKAASV